MRILVTGATGFIGNHVILELLQRGHQVIATSRNSSKAEQFSWYSKVSFIPFNLDDTYEGSFKDYFHQPDLLIHLSWDGLPNYKQLFHFESELQKQYNFIKK